MKSSVCMCFSTKGTEEPYKTVKLTLYDRATASPLERKTIGLKPKTKKSAKSAISRRPFAETNQTARISLQISSMSKSNPETKTRPVRPNLPARPPSSTPELSTFRSIQTSAQPPFQRPSTTSAAPVKGLLRIPTGGCKWKNCPNCTFFLFFIFRMKTWVWRNFVSPYHVERSFLSNEPTSWAF